MLLAYHVNVHIRKCAEVIDECGFSSTDVPFYSYSKRLHYSFYLNRFHMCLQKTGKGAEASAVKGQHFGDHHLISLLCQVK
jgi:hypothetical protein